MEPMESFAVILAGAGVWLTDTHWPDIAVAVVIAYLGLTGASQVLRQAWGELRAPSRLAPAA